MMEGFQSFLNTLQKRGSKPHHISHCLGTRQAWKWVRRNRWELLKGYQCSSSLYSSIVNEVNRILAGQLLEGHEIVFPHLMGSLLLSSTPAKVSVTDGRIENNYRVDWKKTLDYWYEDREARESHRTIKRIQSRIYFIQYSKESARYNNKRFYLFRANRSLVRKLGTLIENGRVNSKDY